MVAGSSVSQNVNLRPPAPWQNWDEPLRVVTQLGLLNYPEAVWSARMATGSISRRASERSAQRQMVLSVAIEL